MLNKLNQINNILFEKINQSIFRERKVTDYQSKTINIEKCEFLNFTSNDYLGLSQHSILKNILKHSIDHYGIGSQSSALISGYYRSHQLCEEKMAVFLKRDRAILFNSGYLANIGAICSLAPLYKIILVDQYCHRSMYDGIHLSRARYIRFKHQNLEHLKYLLQQYSDALIMTESIFSMIGDICLIKQIHLLAKQYHAGLYVDDAHGVGILGKEGRGVASYNIKIDCLITPLGKAFGHMGAIISGSNETIEMILQCAATYRYTTAIPPAIATSLISSCDILLAESWRRKKLFSLISFFVRHCNIKKIPCLSCDLTPIKCILIKCNQKALDIQKKLLQDNIFVSCIRPPSVPNNRSILRISLNCFHTKKQISILLNKIKKHLDE